MHLSHPLLKPALRRGWRDLRTVQFGATPAHAVVLGPIDTATGSFMELLDGTRGLPLLREEAHRMGFAEGYADLLVCGSPARACSTTPPAAARALRRCANARRWWSGSGPTSAPSR